MLKMFENISLVDNKTDVTSTTLDDLHETETLDMLDLSDTALHLSDTDLLQIANSITDDDLLQLAEDYANEIGSPRDDKKLTLEEQLEELKKQHYELTNRYCTMKEELNTLLNDYRCEMALRYDAESRYEILQFSIDLEKVHMNSYQTAIGLAKVRYAELVRRCHSVDSRLNSLPVFERLEEINSEDARLDYYQPE